MDKPDKLAQVLVRALVPEQALVRELVPERVLEQAERALVLELGQAQPVLEQVPLERVQAQRVLQQEQRLLVVSVSALPQRV